MRVLGRHLRQVCPGGIRAVAVMPHHVELARPRGSYTRVRARPDRRPTALKCTCGTQYHYRSSRSPRPPSIESARTVAGALMRPLSVHQCVTGARNRTLENSIVADLLTPLVAPTQTALTRVPRAVTTCCVQIGLLSSVSFKRPLRSRALGSARESSGHPCCLGSPAS
jgi:hypothetical protein